MDFLRKRTQIECEREWDGVETKKSSNLRTSHHHDDGRNFIRRDRWVASGLRLLSILWERKCWCSRFNVPFFRTYRTIVPAHILEYIDLFFIFIWFASHFKWVWCDAITLYLLLKIKIYANEFDPYILSTFLFLYSTLFAKWKKSCHVNRYFD